MPTDCCLSVNNMCYVLCTYCKSTMGVHFVLFFVSVCLVNVHEHSCKEHIPACDKFKPKVSNYPPLLCNMHENKLS